MKKILKVLSLSLALLMLTLSFTSCDVLEAIPGVSSIFDFNKSKYEKACALLEEDKIEEAYELLKEIEDYEPAAEKLKGFIYLPQEIVTDHHRFGTLYLEYDAHGNTTYCTSTAKVINDHYKYDANGNRTYSNDPFFGECYYTYKDGKLTKRTQSHEYVSPSGTYTYEYNSKNELTKVKLNGEVYEEFSYVYHDNGNPKVIIVSQYDEYDDYYGFYTTIKLSYNEDGILTEIITTYDTTQVAKVTFTYNEFGPSKIRWEYPNFEFSMIYTFSYDADGKQTSLNLSIYGGGSPYSDQSTTIEYSNHKLCYVENSYAKTRADRILGRELAALMIY